MRWTFDDGPVTGMRFERVLNDDGTVVWRRIFVAGAGYAATQISDDVHAVSYLAKSGNTLTVVPNLATGRAFGFGSSHDDWHSMTGTFEVVQ